MRCGERGIGDQSFVSRATEQCPTRNRVRELFLACCSDWSVVGDWEQRRRDKTTRKARNEEEQDVSHVFYDCVVCCWCWCWWGENRTSKLQWRDDNSNNRISTAPRRVACFSLKTFHSCFLRSQTWTWIRPSCRCYLTVRQPPPFVGMVLAQIVGRLYPPSTRTDFLEMSFYSARTISWIPLETRSNWSA